MEHKFIYDEVKALNEIIVQLKRNNELLEQVVSENVSARRGGGNTGKESEQADSKQYTAQNNTGERQATKKPRERTAAN